MSIFSVFSTNIPFVSNEGSFLGAKNQNLFNIQPILISRTEIKKSGRAIISLCSSTLEFSKVMSYEL